ncbi:hypothetical protein LP419_02190 [Massilia sp. H-1]|nr:hypothetical protein LP419_02190 [Massilia sp. H-1]
MALLDVLRPRRASLKWRPNWVSSGVGMVLGLPLPLSRAGAPRGALCLMFGHARPIKPDEMAAYVGMAQLARALACAWPRCVARTSS